MNFLFVHVKLGENQSICCRSTATLQIKYGSRHFFEIEYGGRQLSWIPNNANYEGTLGRAVIF
jgi:hypothetical protein